MVDAVITVQGLRKRYAQHEAVKGIDFTVDQGEVFGFLGTNGAGKTTTIEILEGYRSRTAGVVTVLGIDPARPTAAWRERIGLVLQESELDPLHTVRETVTMFACYYRHPRPVADTIALVGLTEQRDTRVGRSRGVRSDGSTSRWASSATPISCSSTNRRPASTRRPAARPGT